MEIRVSVEIDRSATDVFGYIAEVSNNPAWQNGQRSCRWTSDPPLRVGSTYDQTARFLGRTITSSFEVIEFVPGSRIRIVTTGGAMPIDVTREVTPDRADGGRCTVTAVVAGEPGGVFGPAANLAGPALRILARSAIRRDYQRLKQLLERSGPEG